MTLARLSRPGSWALAPFEQLSGLREEINRLFDEPFSLMSGEFFNGWSPALDLAEDSENLVATIELPGMKKEDIQVTIHEGVLSVSGERKRDEKKKASESYRTERFCGRFHRMVSLPKPVKTDAIKAAYRDGILTVTMPKTEEAKPKQIEVKVG